MLNVYWKLGKNPEKRVILVKKLWHELVNHDRIETTWSRAKELKRHANHIIRLAKKGGNEAELQEMFSYRPALLQKVQGEMMDRYKDMPETGDFVKLWNRGQRRKDSARMVVVEFIGAKHDMTKYFDGLEAQKNRIDADRLKTILETLKPIQEAREKAIETEKNAVSALFADGKTITLSTPLPVTSSYQLLLKERVIKQSDKLPKMYDFWWPKHPDTSNIVVLKDKWKRVMESYYHPESRALHQHRFEKIRKETQEAEAESETISQTKLDTKIKYDLKRNYNCFRDIVRWSHNMYGPKQKFPHNRKGGKKHIINKKYRLFFHKVQVRPNT